MDCSLLACLDALLLGFVPPAFDYRLNLYRPWLSRLRRVRVDDDLYDMASDFCGYEDATATIVEQVLGRALERVDNGGGKIRHSTRS